MEGATGSTAGSRLWLPAWFNWAKNLSREAFERLGVLVPGKAGHVRCVAAPRMNVNMTRELETHPGPGQCEVKVPVGWRDEAVGVGHALGGGGANEAVSGLYTGDPTRPEQSLLRGVGHGGGLLFAGISRF